VGFRILSGLGAAGIFPMSLAYMRRAEGEMRVLRANMLEPAGAGTP